MVTCPPEMHTVKPAKELGSIKVNQCLLGTCAGGTLDDLRTAASILKGKKNTRRREVLSISRYKKGIRTGGKRRIACNVVGSRRNYTLFDLRCMCWCTRAIGAR